MTNDNENSKQVIETNSETVKNNYVVSDVKSDNEVIFDLYSTSMTKTVDYEIHSDEDTYEVSSEKVHLNESDADKSIADFKKEPIDSSDVRCEIEDRAMSSYTVHSEEDSSGDFIVNENNIDASVEKMSVSDYINKEIESHKGGYFFQNLSRDEMEKKVMCWLNNTLIRSNVDYECVKILKDNKLTFGLIKKVNNNQNQKAA